MLKEKPMFTLSSLAAGYNNAKLLGNNEDKNIMGNMLIMEIMQNPKEILSLQDTKELGITLFSISYDSKSIESENSNSYKLGLMIAFYCLYKAYKQNKLDYAINVNLNMLWLINPNIIIQWYQNGSIAKNSITEPITSFSQYSFIYNKINVLEQLLKEGTLNEHPDYEEYLEIINLCSEKLFSKT